MKLLTRLRELRTQSSIEELFDNFHYTVEGISADVMGLGATTSDDIARLLHENYKLEKSEPNCTKG
jgi:hypothetical protein